jgi:hypothetical protein
MTSIETILRSKYGESHPGLNLVGVTPFAIPLSPFRLSLVVYESKDYPLLNEYLLRCVNLGIRKIDSIAETLGVDRELVVEVIADEQIVAGTIAQTTGGEFLLTGYGTDKIRDFKVHESKNITRDLYVDRLTGDVAFYSDVYPSEQAARKSLEKVDGAPVDFIFPEPQFKDKVETKFFSPEALNKLFHVNSSPGADMSVIEVISAKKRSTKKHFKIALLMIFADESGRNIELDLAIDGAQSKRHNTVLANANLLSSFGIKVLPTPPDPITETSFFAKNREFSPAADVLTRFARFEVVEDIQPEEKLESTGKSSTAAPSPARLGHLRKDIPGIFQDPGGSVRVRVQDHPALLGEAIQFCTTRLLIISPWAKSAVVDRSFANKLERAAARGVQIDIGIGFGDDLSDSHKFSIDLLMEVSKRHSNFRLHKLKSHEKILIADNAYVSTSFNWLSFKGISENHYRRENGTRIVNKEDVDILYSEFVEEINAEREPGWP